MSYDRDLKWQRRAILALFLGTLIPLVVNFAARKWAFVIAEVVWLFNLLVMLSLIKSQQTTRDRARIAESMINYVREQMERGEE